MSQCKKDLCNDEAVSAMPDSTFRFNPVSHTAHATDQHHKSVLGSPESLASDYFQRAYKYPLLSVKDEIALFDMIRTGTPEERESAREHFILANLRLVVKIAHSYRNRGLSLFDLIAEGNLGLMQAVDRFEPNHGAKFSTYAATWIKQAMLSALKNQTNTIRIPFQTQIKMAKVNRMCHEFFQKNGRPPKNEEISQITGYRIATVRRLQLYQNKVVSLDDLLTNGDGDEYTLENKIIDVAGESTFDVLSKREQMAMLPQYVEKLSCQERMVIKMRFGLGGQGVRSLDEISTRLHRTKERVRQIQNEAIFKLREYVGSQSTF